MDDKQLAALADELEAVGRLVDSAPQRFEATPAGYLAEADADVIMSARRVVNRLMLWRRYPNVSPESYLPLAPTGGDTPEVTTEASTYLVSLNRGSDVVELEVSAWNATLAKHEALTIQGTDWTVDSVERVHWGPYVG